MLYFGYLVVNLFQILLYCWPSNELMEKSFGVGNAAYQSLWTNLHNNSSKAVILMILRAQNPLVISAGGMYDMTLQNFTKTLNETPVNLISLCSYLGLCFGNFFQILLFCWSGQKLMDQAVEVGIAAYQSFWTNLPIKSTKSLFLLILRTQYPMMISAGGFYDMTLENFTSVDCRTDFGYSLGMENCCSAGIYHTNAQLIMH